MTVEVLSPQRASRSIRLTLTLFVITMAVSAVLMFLLEPMAAKMVLPLLGGAPAVWNTCVVFFQAMLLAGYAYAHGGPQWLGLRQHALVHAVLLAVPLIFLPFTLGGTPPTEGQPIIWLLTILLTSIGLPFFMLTTTAPLLQKWFSGTDHPDAADPYFLYAASNIGSLAGLLLYPGLVEPTLRIRDQVLVWSFGYAVFAVMAITCAVILWRRPVVQEVHLAVPAAEEVGWVRRVRWVALAFAPSSLMLAVTTYVSTDVAAVPLLWVVPLALYLLSFVLAFNPPRFYPRTIVDRAFPLLLLPLILPMILQGSGSRIFAVPIWVHMLAFFVAALICHRALADDRPHSTRLTEFYLWVALGGVLGSLFNTLAAPMLFTGVIEYPLALVLVCLLRRVPEETSTRTPPVKFGVALAAGALTAAVSLWGSRIELLSIRLALLAVATFLCLSISRARVPFAAAVSLMLLGSLLQTDHAGRVLHAERTFFGTYRVRLDPGGRFRSLAHGTTLHGMQALAPDRAGEPLTYFERTGPFGDVFRAVPAAKSPRVAVIGLGIGSLAAYQEGEQRWTFYEIDPAVEHIARNATFFSFLSGCAAHCDVVIGDARLSLARAPEAQYGIIVLDAFSSDAIPIHLITRQAVELYLSRVIPGGAVVFHISNRHLDLQPVLAKIAQELGLVARIRRDRVSDQEADRGKTGSDWVVMARNAADLGALATGEKWTATEVKPRVRAWTDDFSNILSVLNR